MKPLLSRVKKVHKSGFLSVLMALFVIIQAPSLSGAASPSVPLSLTDAITIALENNVDIRIERETIRLRELSLTLEDAQFDPALRMGTRTDRSTQTTSSTIDTTVLGTNKLKQTKVNFQAGLKQRLRWGGDYGLSLNQTRSTRNSGQVFNPTFTGDAVLTVTQPLLQGLGREITQGLVHIAQTDITISRTAFRSKVSTLLFDINSTYWDLVFQRENLKVKQQALQSARQLLEANRAKVELGLLAPIEILVAEAGAASREESVVIAEKEIEDKEDELRRLLNLPEQSLIDPPSLHPTDKPMDTERPIERGKTLKVALTRRPEIEENHLNLRNRALLLRIAKNQLFPSLDFVGRLGLNGLGQTYAQGFDQITSKESFRWEVGLELQYPIGNRRARANFKKEKTEQNKAILAQTKIVQQITLEVKKALRRVRTDFHRIKTTRRARVLAERQLSAGTERFSLGLISSNDLLEFQDDLAEARVKALKAVLDYNKSLASLDGATGTLLEKYGVETPS